MRRTVVCEYGLYKENLIDWLIYLVNNDYVYMDTNIPTTWTHGWADWIWVVKGQGCYDLTKQVFWSCEGHLSENRLKPERWTD